MYSLIDGDFGPELPITLSETFLDTDTVTLHYIKPDGTSSSRAATIVNSSLGQVKVSWIAGDLGQVGFYRGHVTIARNADPTYPRTYPDDGTTVIWGVWTVF